MLTENVSAFWNINKIVQNKMLIFKSKIYTVLLTNEKIMFFL